MDKSNTDQLHAVMLLATLKPSPQRSNTDLLCRYTARYFTKNNAASEVIRLVDYHILPGLKRDMGEGDQWPEIIPKLLASDIIIFATPIWWGLQSSLMQRVIERLDTENDTLLETGISPFANKAGGIVITGAEDGAQHIIANLCNFMVWNGLTMPPACSVSRLGDIPEDKSDEEIFAMFDSESTKDMAEVMARNLTHIVRLLHRDPYKDKRVNRTNISAGAVGIRHK
ncbi:MAG: Multimeric flavodoxin WrbA-like protein [Parcubacteria group bacterium Gr01-1014_66]|nr:MAG: Multimeric flavodoxin WrbA-like protein [Parcubacteria group bacterium Gr01-1014_66]